MFPPLTTDEVVALRECVRSQRQHLNGISDFLSREAPNGSNARALITVGDKQRRLDAIDFRLREEYARLTGMPVIEHSNADIADCSSPSWPTAREDEAREASSRG
jgi:hypothetical protein